MKATPIGRRARAASLLFLIGACLVATPRVVRAQSTSIRFRHLSAEDGLSQVVVQSILQDRRGFMWFGTEDGLNRYDGYTFTVFRHDDLDPFSLAHNYVESLVEDANGFIWVGTTNGLDRWDPRTDRFEHFKHDAANPGSLSQDRVTAILLDRGTLWVGTDDAGLNRFEGAEAAFTRFHHDPGDSGSLSSDKVSALCAGRDGSLWVGTRDAGLNRFDPSTGRALRYGGGLASDIVSSIYEADDGLVWVGTMGGGLHRLDPETGEIVGYSHDPSDPSGLSSNHIEAVFMGDPGTLWVATSRGLDELRMESGVVYHHRRDPSEPSSLIDDEVVSLYQDRGSVMWVGTGKGLSRWNTLTNAFGYVSESSAGLSSDTVTSFGLQSADVLWIGTFGGGLNRMNRNDGTIERFRHDASSPSSLSDDRAMSILVDRHGTLWVGTFAGGLNRFDGVDRFERFRHDAEDGASLSSDAVVALHESKGGEIWVGTFEGGLNRLDPATGAFEHFRANPVDASSLSDDRVQCIFEDDDGVLWVGTDGGGLNRFDDRTRAFTTYRHDPADPDSLSSDTVYSVAEDEQGTLWVGTDQGLNEWNVADRRVARSRFKKYKTRHGLPNDVVYGIVTDDRRALWMSTNHGLARLDVDSKECEVFGPSHGLQGNEFNFGAYHKSTAGELFFGGLNGFNHFHPERVRSPKPAPPVVMTSFLKLNEAVELDRPISETDEVEIDYRDYVITFEFAALDYTAPEQNRYAYKLEGFNEDWIDLGTVRRATYTNLDAGDYVLRVKGSNNDGVWNEQGAELRLSVLPAPWETWWAYTLYALVFGACVGLIAGAQARKLRREAEHARLLEDQVQERTQELAERNQELVVVNSMLEQAAVTDSLTGLLNRRYLTTHITTELAVVTRQYVRRRLSNESSGEGTSHDLVFMMTDLDGLKRINDEYGHLAGDKAIIQMCEILKATCRTSDTLIRWGGDEFMIVGRGLDREGVEILAHRIRDAVVEHEFDVGDEVKLGLSCSIGFASFPFSRAHPDLMTGEQVLSLADQALYIAKRSGRNSWVGIFEQDGPAPEDVTRLLAGELEALAEEGVIELATSLVSLDDLVVSAP